MLSLPSDIILKIGMEDKKAYIAMLAIPRFARLLTAGIRLDSMEKFGYSVSIACYTRNHRMLLWTINATQNMGGNIPYINSTFERHYESGHLFAICMGREWSIVVRDCTYVSFGIYLQHGISIINITSWNIGYRIFNRDYLPKYVSHTGILS